MSLHQSRQKDETLTAVYVTKILTADVVERSADGKKQIVQVLAEYSDGSVATRWRTDWLYPDGAVLEGDLSFFQPAPLTPARGTRPLIYLLEGAVHFWLLDGGNLERLPNFLHGAIGMLPAAITADPLYGETIVKWQSAGEDEETLVIFLDEYIQERVVPAGQLDLGIRSARE